MASQKQDPLSSLRKPAFRFFVAGRFGHFLAIQMVMTTINLQIYFEYIKNVFKLGLLGLAEAVPFILLSFFTGLLADKYYRKRLIQYGQILFFILTVILYLFTTSHFDYLKQYGTTPIFIIVVLLGVQRAFISPSMHAFMAQLIPRTDYANAATINSSAFHIAAIAGPAISGMLYAWVGAGTSYLIFLSIIVLSYLSIHKTPDIPVPKSESKETAWQKVTAGIKFVYHKQVLLSALTLDLFAVLFGGAIALMPAFADQVLNSGPEVAGWLRTAPAIGALIMTVYLIYHPPMTKSGTKMLWNVAGFGLATILFALSTNLWLSLFLMMLTGAFDMVSVMIRHTIVQLLTPDDMRGRVSAINSIFIGSSNEIGAFESGVAARLLGLIPSVIFGGMMTIATVGAVSLKAPKLRKLNISEIQ
ncbi:MAG TPA: MFS transporter [Bacteroidia bacterium]|nr:MFS transporter [Bacteroidia bacterium]HNT79166.1 MFS transporter [Bacteroidia bacterium]